MRLVPIDVVALARRHVPGAEDAAAERGLVGHAEGIGVALLGSVADVAAAHSGLPNSSAERWRERHMVLVQDLPKCSNQAVVLCLGLDRRNVCIQLNDRSSC